MANEGLGLFAFAADWTTICEFPKYVLTLQSTNNELAAHGNPLWTPFQTLMNSMFGYILSIGLYMALFYGNVWSARKFPFLSPLMYQEKSSAKKYSQYNQTHIMNSRYEIDNDKLKEYGLPRLTVSTHSVQSTLVFCILILGCITHSH
jgi:hypothetical protein